MTDNIYIVLVDATIYETFKIEASSEEAATVKAAELFEELYTQITPELRDYDILYEAFIEEKHDD